jgi:Holliday junction resolvase
MKKGIEAERELFHLLKSKGFFVIRAAGSGHLKAPDIMAFKKGSYLGFEVKAHDKSELRFSKEQLENMKTWQENTGITMYVAWKIKRKGFLFIPLSYLKANEKTVCIKIEDAEKLAYKDWEL